jgi:hypothetical protein
MAAAQAKPSLVEGCLPNTGAQLYVSNLGAAPGAAGQILRFDISPGY